jgi:hypothetical protein
MANYSSPLLQTLTTSTFKSAGFLFQPASSGRRILMYEVEMGQLAAAASTDCQVEWDISRFSATNIITATAVTPQLLDNADTAVAVSLFSNNAVAEPTFTTAGNGLNLKHWGINQRGSYRWRALDDGDHLGLAVTGQLGFMIRPLSSSFTGTTTGTISYTER